MAGSIRLEKAGKPVVFVVADHFLRDAMSSAEDNGMPGLPMVTVPVDEYYRLRITREAVTPVAIGAIDRLVDALTRPSKAGEATPPEQTDVTATMKISGPSYEVAFEKFNQLFLGNHWGSGLPMVPPTREHVGWMLTGTSRHPHEVLGTVAPKSGIATIEKVAINAVMAGARPEYLPVIIAAMEAVTDRRYDLLHPTASTGSFTLQILVSGPIAEEIGINSGIGFLGYGWRANSTVGHAVRLCLINLGHVWPGENDMALIGRPSSHTLHVFAENTAQSPWEPYHVSVGYEPRDSCVTVSTATSHNSSILGGGAVEPWNLDSILTNIVSAIRRSRRHMTRWRLGTAIPSPPRYTFFLHPEFAIELNNNGFNRKSLRDYLYEESSIPFEELTLEEIDAVRRRISAGEIPSSRITAFQDALAPGRRVPLLLAPEDCHFVVAGGMPGYSFETSYFSIPPYSTVATMTKKVRGATLTRAGR